MDYMDMEIERLTGNGGGGTFPTCGFRLLLGDLGDKDLSHRIDVTAGEMAERRSVELDGGAFEVEWSRHPLLGDDFRARAVFTPLAEGGWRYEFGYSGNSSALSVERVGFPDIVVPRTDATRILAPVSQGLLLRPDWASMADGAQVGTWDWPAICASCFAAIGPDGDSWYIDQRGDARRHATYFVAYRDGPSTLRMVAWYEMAVTAESSRAFKLPFDGVIRHFRGGWFEAAAIYRDWVRTQDFWKRAAARPRGRLADIAMWFWNRGASDKVIAPVERFMEDAGVPAALDWYWWHKIPYDTEFPDFWPPREPEAAFRAGVTRCREKGIYVQPYVNGMTWDCDAPTWDEGGREGRVVKRDGETLAVMFNCFARHRLAWMCAEADAHHDRLGAVIHKLAGCGFNAVYMDMINNAAYGGCWNPGHRHAPGGGTLMVDGYRDFVSRVRAANPGIQLSSEDGNEAFLEYFDSAISLFSCYERLTGRGRPDYEHVPLFNAVFHPCVTTFGTFATVHGIPAWDETWPTERKWKHEEPWEKLFPDQFAVEVARGAIWGVQPCVHNFLLENARDPRFAEDYAFMVATARFWHANRPWLFLGEMQSPGRLDTATRKVSFMVRSTYSKEGDYRVVTDEALPAVLHSVWTSPDGRLAAVLANWTREPQSWRLETCGATAEGVIPPRSWHRADLA